MTVKPVTDREKIDRALAYVELASDLNPRAHAVLLEGLQAGRRASLDGWERASRCRQITPAEIDKGFETLAEM